MIGDAVTGVGTEGLVRVGQGFSVNAAKLRTGSEQVSDLEGRCEIIAGEAVDALAGMASLAGHPALASALTGAAGQGLVTFWAVGSAYHHVSNGLNISAETYSSTERAIAAKAGTIFRDLR
jgi:hypothetical protein